MTSIRRRILLPLVPLTGLVLLGVGLAVESWVRGDLTAGLDRSLVVRANELGSSVDVELGGGLEFDLEEMQRRDFRGRGGEVVFTVADDAGETLFISEDTPEIPTVRSDLGPSFTVAELDGRRYRVCSLSVVREPEDDEEDREEWLELHPDLPLPEPVPRTFWITVGQPTAALEATLAALRARLVVGLGTLFLALVAIPAWVVSRALRPLRQLSRQADSISPESTERRLGEESADREVVSLVAALNRALDRLSRAYQRQQRFTADAAHELRTPLTALRTSCEVALRKECSSEALRQALESVLRTALRMNDLVHDLLELSRLQQEPTAVPTSPVDLAESVREAALLHASQAEVKGVRLDLELASEVWVQVNAGLLVECVANLLENAIRHTPGGGVVEVRTTAVPSPRVVVRDSGCGITEEHLEKIFERFYRVDPGRSRSDGGAGLGLALVQEIARVHGGQVNVVSEPGRGSCFTVTLPVHGGEQFPSQEEAPDTC